MAGSAAGIWDHASCVQSGEKAAADAIAHLHGEQSPLNLVDFSLQIIVRYRLQSDIMSLARRL